MTRTRDEDQVGSLADEALRLFDALASRAQMADSHEERAGGGPDGRAGSPECTWCPLCRVLRVVRHPSPEVHAHLATAAAELMRAAVAMRAAQGPERSGASEGRGRGEGAGEGGGDAENAAR